MGGNARKNTEYDERPPTDEISRPARRDYTSAAEHRTLGGELLHTKRDGTQISVASRWSLQRDLNGRPVATLETNNDITERKRAEEALSRSQATYLAEAQKSEHHWQFRLEHRDRRNPLVGGKFQNFRIRFHAQSPRSKRCYNACTRTTFLSSSV